LNLSAASCGEWLAGRFKNVRRETRREAKGFASHVLRFLRGTPLSVSRFQIHYGREYLTVQLPAHLFADPIAPHETSAASDPLLAVNQALDAPLGGRSLANFAGAKSAAIAINDKTRPVPHRHLLPPLLHRLEALGLSPASIMLIIATGTHPSMPPEEFPAVLPAEIIDRYPVLCHDAEDRASLVNLGETTRGTPIWINRHFARADLRVVIGNIEPHQFQGFSGGVKSAAIGLGGRETVSRNHALMTDPDSKLGEYARNPARQDVEEIGRRIGIHFALNAVLNDRKEIVHMVAGEPAAVMEAGIPSAREICQVQVAGLYDFVIASPGGHPKDINIYQAQKALAHASLITRPGGEVIIVAACPEGIGSRSCETWLEGVTSFEAVFEKFKRDGFHVGPHKAYQITRDASRVHVQLISQMPPEMVKKFLLSPAASLDEAIAHAVMRLPAKARVGVMTRANGTIPVLIDN
jgi:nickel-dependent lactate racemase